MRLSVLLACTLASFAPPAFAAKRAAPAASRAPASKSGYKIATFQCTASDGQPASALGLVRFNPDLKSDDTGFFGLSFFARLANGSVASKSLTGAYTTVPDGYVLQVQWVGAPGDQVLLHLHPREQTSIPGVAGALSCKLDAKMNQI